jgi:S1-C subfamily serine protease
VDIDAAGLSTAVAPVAFRKDRTFFAMQGSAFCIAGFESGEVIFATAKHVIEELVDNPQLEAFLLLPAGLATREERRSLIGVRVHQIALAEAYSDAALMVANPRQSELDVVSRLTSMPISFGPPQVGQYCMALGYPQEPGSTNYKLLASRGTIEEVHPRRRDNAMSTFPSFRTNALYKHGMSGGPIVATSGRVIGIISHGTEADKREFIVGYGASIAAIAELKLDLYDNSGTIHEFSIVQLADMGFLGSSSEPAVTLHRADDGVTLTWASPGDGGD